MNLNKEQYEACHAPLGHNLVIASAGTGKTSTIVGRIAVLLNDKRLKPEQILLLTFTNKASNEMIGRVAKMFGKDIANRICSGTFHSVAYKCLKERRGLLLKQPRELKILFKSIYDKRLFKSEKNKQYSYEYLYESYSLFRSSTVSKSYEQWLEDRNDSQLEFIDIYEGIFEEYEALKESYGYVDYNDLLILYKDEIISLRTEGKMDYIEVLCDEYQDTNPLQDSIINTINPQSLFCVGDYDQSIYAFNGADISIITNFTTTHSDARIFSLSKNYRSGKYILELANKVIEHNPRIYPKQLEVFKTTSTHKPELLEYNDLFSQYSEIARKISSLHKSGIDYGDMAVIYRNNSSADGIQASLRALNIDSKRKGSASFFDSKEVEFLLCLCSTMANPRDMMSYIHILSHAKGIGNSIAKDIFEALMIVGDNNCTKGLLNPKRDITCYKRGVSNSAAGLFDEFFRLEDRARFNDILHKDFHSHPILEHYKIQRDAALFLNDFFIFYKQNYHINTPSALIRQILKTDFYNNFLDSLIKQRVKNKDGSILQKDYEDSKKKALYRLEILQNLSANYRDLKTFLNATMLGSSEFAEGGGVNLLSVHASKGLEFEVVFVIDLMDGRFPNHKLASKSGSIEEERRLFYVALTRAKEMLYLSFAKNDIHKGKEYEPSIFLYECEMMDKKSHSRKEV